MSEVLLLLPEVFADHGGIQRMGRDLFEAFRRAVPGPGVAARVLNDSPAAVAAGWPGADVGGSSRRRLRFSISSVVAASRGRPRLVLLGHRHLLPLAPLLAAASPRSRQALLVYGAEAQRPLGALERGWLRWVHRWLAISPHTAAAFTAAGAPGVPQLLPCSLAWNWPLPAPSAPAFDPPRRLLSVARLVAADRDKGVDDVIEALARLPPEAATLDVVGEGDDRPRLERLAGERGVAGRVRFHGGVPDQRLRELYAACDVFVLPSSREGFGIVYLEAMAHCRPVIAADADASPFAVRAEESGWLVPPGRPALLAERLEALFRDPDTARRVGRTGRELLEREFSFEAMAARAAELVRCASST